MKKILIAGAASVILLSLITVSCTRSSSGRTATSPSEQRLSDSEDFLSIIQRERTPGLPYDDSVWKGTGYNPEGPPGVEGNMPPAFRDMSNLFGGMEQMEMGSTPGDYLEREEFDPRNFDRVVDNPFRRVADNPLSTFSVDVDTAGYSITRRYLLGNRMPPKSAIRIEELINYFDYDYPPPNDGRPFAVHTETASAPWNPGHLLARVAIKGKEFPAGKRPRVNLVFLLDVSGSMDAPNRLPLVISSMNMLVNELNGTDKVAICVYAGAAGTVLPPTSCDKKKTIIAALDKLEAGGSTAGGTGIQLAYRLAEQNFDPQAVNRVILCTDGDFNVGITNRGDLIDLITEKAKSGVYLTALGFGMDNFQDGRLKQLASKGNGNYGYIDTIEEAKKILVDQLSGTLVTIAQDVKIQVEFNRATVGAYRLIGYENRVMRNEDFNNDEADAGDIGAGHTVTAFYELIPADSPEVAALPGNDPLKYAPQPANPDPDYNELLTVKIRYKPPTGSQSILIEFPVAVSSVRKAGEESRDFLFAASVAGFGMLLRDSPHRGNLTYTNVIDMAQGALGQDVWGYREGFIRLAQKARTVSGNE